MRQDFKALGEYFQSKRIASGISQKDVAGKLGYSSPQFVSNWERGLCAPPTEALTTLIRLYDLSAKEVVAKIMIEQEKLLVRELGLKSNIKVKKRK